MGKGRSALEKVVVMKRTSLIHEDSLGKPEDIYELPKLICKIAPSNSLQQCTDGINDTVQYAV
jgi:hypothetical protein